MRTLLAVVVAVIAVVALVSAQHADPFSGRWRLNVSRSLMVSPATASKSETVTYTHTGAEERFVADAVTASGEPERIEYRAVYDGPAAPIVTTLGGKATEARLQLRRLDTRTRLRLGVRPDGTIGGIIVRRLSEDGRTITSSILRFENDGRVVNHETRVFEKQ